MTFKLSIFIQTFKGHEIEGHWFKSKYMPDFVFIITLTSMRFKFNIFP